ncbi:hypothetical protein MFMK1_002111 [Metallumcola ferriviriculae]|uniref:Uncharacterized protein n=1 Tax=Metallumcola ferriviriculae TaxID=3039180 RepID=A0AAU0UMD6_9FIRM|nr:hypothetical protein MFMK1_002111 [Desulfitibacteraceae bacterium MK1]
MVVPCFNGLEDAIAVVNEKVMRSRVPVVRVGTKQTVSWGGQRNYGVVQGSRVSSSYGWSTHPIRVC